MTRVKMCGLMNPHDVQLCVEAGVDMLGFVVDYPSPVPWNLPVVEARDLIKGVSPFVSTCIVTGGSVEKVMDLVDKTKPNVVQLHYKETLAEVKEIAFLLGLKGIKTIKALRIDKQGKCDFDFTDPVLAVKELCNTGISAILVDSYTETRPGGGTGLMIDASTFTMIKQVSMKPVILAGGLNPSNIHTLVNELHPYAVDVMTGIEERPGKKDAQSIHQFMKMVSTAKYDQEKAEQGIE